MIRFQQAQQELNMAAAKFAKASLIGGSAVVEPEEHLAKAAKAYICECARMSGSASVEDFLEGISP